jgi:hypothetical protein
MINVLYIITSIFFGVLILHRFYLVENYRNKVSNKEKEGIFTLLNKYESSFSLVINILFIIPYSNKQNNSNIRNINITTIILYVIILLHILSICIIHP